MQRLFTIVNWPIFLLLYGLLSLFQGNLPTRSIRVSVLTSIIARAKSTRLDINKLRHSVLSPRRNITMALDLVSILGQILLALESMLMWKRLLSVNQLMPLVSLQLLDP